MKLAQNWDDLGRREPEFLDEFRTFCQLLTECRARAEALPSTPLTPDTFRGEAQGLRTHLLEALEAQGRKASRESGPYGYEIYREVQYVEAVLADEIFLSLDWPGRQFWSTHLLEAQLFGTHTAGEAVFTHVERLLADRHAGPEGLELLYFIALCLGFQGQYRDRQDQSTISRYKRELYRRYYFKNPSGVQRLPQAFPDCYEHTLDSFLPQRLPSPARWVTVLCISVLAWLIITQIAWSHLTDDLRAAMEPLNHSNAAAPLGASRGN